MFDFAKMNLGHVVLLAGKESGVSETLIVASALWTGTEALLELPAIRLEETLIAFNVELTAWVDAQKAKGRTIDDGNLRRLLRPLDGGA